MEATRRRPAAAQQGGVRQSHLGRAARRPAHMASRGFALLRPAPSCARQAAPHRKRGRPLVRPAARWCAAGKRVGHVVSQPALIVWRGVQGRMGVSGMQACSSALPADTDLPQKKYSMAGRRISTPAAGSSARLLKHGGSAQGAGSRVRRTDANDPTATRLPADCHGLRCAAHTSGTAPLSASLQLAAPALTASPYTTVPPQTSQAQSPPLQPANWAAQSVPSMGRVRGSATTMVRLK